MKNNIKRRVNKNKISIVRLWGEGVMLCNDFILSTNLCKYYKEDNNSILEAHLHDNIIKNLYDILFYGDSRVMINYCNKIIIYFLQVISLCHESSLKSKEFDTELLRNAILTTPSNIHQYNTNLLGPIIFQIINLQIFIHLLSYLHIDERVICSERGQLEIFLTSILTYIGKDINPKEVLSHLSTVNNYRRETLLIMFNNTSVKISQLTIQHKNKMYYSLPLLLYKYYKLKDFIPNTQSPLHGKFTSLRFL